MSMNNLRPLSRTAGSSTPGGPSVDATARAAAAGAVLRNTDQDTLLGGLRTDVDAKALAADLASLATTVSGKALASDLQALATTVGGKADSTTVEALATAIGLRNNQQDAEIGTKASTAYVDAGLLAKVSQFSFDALKAIQEGKDADHDAAISQRVTTSDFNAGLATKASKASYDAFVTAVSDKNTSQDTAIGLRALATDVTASLLLKADQTALTAQKTRIDTLVGVNGDAGTFAALGVRVTTAEGNIGTNTTGLAALKGRVDTIVGVNGDAGSFAALTTRVTTAETNIGLRSTTTQLTTQTARIDTIIGADGNGGRLKQVEDTLSASGSLYWVGNTIINVPADQATIAAALTAASARVPKDGATVEIVVDDSLGASSPGGGRNGCWIEALGDWSTRNLGHVLIRPKVEPVDFVVSPTTNGSFTGSAGNWLVTWTMGNVDLSSIVAGDRIQLWGLSFATATNNIGATFAAAGTHEVTAVDNTAKTITVRIRSRRTQFDATSSKNDLRITKYPIRFTVSSAAGRVISKASMPTLKHISIIPTGTGATNAPLLTLNDCTMRCWEPDFTAGLICYRPYVGMEGFSYQGIVARDTTFIGGFSASNNTVNFNLVELNGCDMDFRSLCLTGSVGAGIVTVSCRMEALKFIQGDNNIHISGCGGIGTYLSRNSMICVVSHCIVGNVGGDTNVAYSTQYHFYIAAAVNSSLSPPTYSPAIATVGNTNAIITQG